jgi:hypothetical protein
MQDDMKNSIFNLKYCLCKGSIHTYLMLVN